MLIVVRQVHLFGFLFVTLVWFCGDVMCLPFRWCVGFRLVLLFYCSCFGLGLLFVLLGLFWDFDCGVLGL